MGSGNWIVDNLNSALNTWNNKLAEIWQLISTSPEEFKGGGIWDVIVGINGGLQAIGYEDGYTAQKPEGRLYVDGFDSEAAARYHLEGLTDCKIMN